MREVVRELTEREREILARYAQQVEQKRQAFLEARQQLQDMANLIAEDGQEVDLEEGVIRGALPDGAD